MHVWSDCVVRIENGLCVIRFHYVACLRPRNVVEYLTTGALVHGQATGVVALCIVAKRYVLAKNCLKERLVVLLERCVVCLSVCL